MNATTADLQKPAGLTVLEPYIHPEALRRLRLVQCVRAGTDAGQSTAKACAAAGVDQATYSRWTARVADLDISDPTQRDTALEALTPGRSPGRPCSYDVLLELDNVRAKLDTIYLATVGASSDYSAHGRRTAKLATALIRFAEEPECPAALSVRLRRGYQPAAFVRYLRRITPELESRLRGPKNYLLAGPQSRRDMTIRLADGRRADLPAGFLWELDDMSVNQPFWVEGPDGPMLSRQGLYCRDVASGRWLGVELVTRPRESYRAEDILRFLRRLIQIHGRPDMLRLEQGIWRARSITGFRISETGAVIEEPVERPGLAPETQAQLQDGLRSVGLEIQYATSSHRKGGIEGGFNLLQTVIATYTTEYQNAGRYGGEFEHAAKQLRRVRAESHHPSAVGFAPIDAAATAIERAMTHVNGRVLGRAKQPPDEIWTAGTTRRPLPQISRNDLAAFLPDLREVTVRGGLITVQADGRAIDFRSETLIELGYGYKVYARLDATDPSLGAALYNRETSSANHQGLRPGQFIGWADFEVPGPQATIDATHIPGLEARTARDIYGTDDQGKDLRKAQLRAVRTAFRALPRPGQPSVRAATMRDGRGNVAEAVLNSRGADTHPTIDRPGDTRRAATPSLDRNAEMGTDGAIRGRPMVDALPDLPDETIASVDRLPAVPDLVETIDEAQPQNHAEIERL